MNIDLTQLQQLIHIAENANIDELEIHDGEQTIRILCRLPTATADTTLSPSHTTIPALPNTAQQIEPVLPSTPQTTPNTATTANASLPITAPMLGTFYLRANPESAPFVAINDLVTANQTLCIIEAMKIMHEVKADKAGKINQILAKEGDMVEHGQPLFIIE